MIRLILFSLAFHSCFAFGLSLNEAFCTALDQEAVIAARVEVTEAEQSLARIESDPLGLKLDRLRAEHRLKLANAELTRTLNEAHRQIAAAYTKVLNTQTQQNVARTKLALNERLLVGTEIRMENGSASYYDHRVALTAIEETKTNLRVADGEISTALSALQELVNKPVEAAALEPIQLDASVVPPTFENAFNASGAHPDLLKAYHDMNFAQLSFESLNPIYASRAEIDSAEAVFEQAKATQQAAVQDFHIQTLELVNATTNAQEAYLLAQIAQTAARERLDFQQTRMDAGLLSEVEFLQAALEAEEADLNLQTARLDYFNALLALRAGTMVDLGEVGSPLVTMTTCTEG